MKATSNLLLVTLPSVALLLAGSVTLPRAEAQQATADAAAPSATAAATAADAGDAGTTAEVTPTASPLDRPVGADGATYTVRLRDLESRVDELKDQIRRSHTKLSLLSDTILSGGTSGARANIVFKNEMSGAYKLTKALFVLDGAVQYNRQDESGALAQQKEIPIFSGNVATGDHVISVVLKFRGSSLAVFQYSKGYEFEQRSSHSFSAGDGKSVDLTAIAYERGNATTPYTDRPAVTWQEKAGMGAKPAPAAKASGTTTPSSASGSVQVGGAK